MVSFIFSYSSFHSSSASPSPLSPGCLSALCTAYVCRYAPLAQILGKGLNVRETEDDGNSPRTFTEKVI